MTIGAECDNGMDISSLCGQMSGTCLGFVSGWVVVVLDAWEVRLTRGEFVCGGYGL